MHHGVKSYRNTKFPLRLVIDRDLFLCVLVLGFFLFVFFQLEQAKGMWLKRKVEQMTLSDWPGHKSGGNFLD